MMPLLVLRRGAEKAVIAPTRLVEVTDSRRLA
jgi:hypothetical protein